MPVTVVCVYNDAAVLAECLVASVEALRPSAPETELITIDNREHAFTSAGAALMSGVQQATHEVVVLVHQDVYLHSLVAVEEAAAQLLDDPSIGVAGACGIDAHGAIQGRIRDRVVMLGAAAHDAVDVDSLDEVLFAARRADLLATPLSSDPDLAWHAYAVEYGLRCRAAGRRVVALDFPLTHNSLTINLARLDVAHRRVAALYPHQLPVRTTCGVVRDAVPPRPGAVARALQPHRWRYRWLRESLRVWAAQPKVRPEEGAVLADLRLDVDDVLAEVGPLRIVHVTEARQPVSDVVLTRRSVPVTLSSTDADGAVGIATALSPQDSVLFVDLTAAQARAVAAALGTTPRLLGFAEDTGFWLLCGSASSARPAAWTTARATPAGRRRLRAH